MSVAELAQAVTLQDSGRLVKVPGIGKKTAERLLLELKGKLGADIGARRPQRRPTTRRPTSCRRCVALGYSDKEAAAALKALPADVGVSDGIRWRSVRAGEVGRKIRSGKTGGAMRTVGTMAHCLRRPWLRPVAGGRTRCCWRAALLLACWATAAYADSGPGPDALLLQQQFEAADQRRLTEPQGHADPGRFCDAFGLHRVPQ